jgi:hypothetical protein
MLSKKCTNCEKTFYAIKIEGLSKHFYKAKLGKLGFSNICKSCKKELYPDKPKESKRVEKIKTCIVCSKEFDARRWVDTVCSKECKAFRNKVLVKINNSKYDMKARELAKKEISRKNKNKRYTKQEVDFIMENRGIMKLKDIAKKLNRTTRSIILKITQLKAEDEN